MGYPTEPTIADFLEIGANAVRIEDIAADINRGADYECLYGPNAILWSRQTQRDTDLWRSTRLNQSSGDQLEYAVFRRFGVDRVLDTYGFGTATITRSSVSAGAGTIWRGTRIQIYGGGTESKVYRVSSDQPVSASQTYIVVPIEAIKPGKGSAVSGVIESIKIIDPLWDTSLQAIDISCGDGTELEDADSYRKRALQTRLDSRVGYTTSIIKACNAEGATNVALFPFNYRGMATQHGLNYVYVGDSGYSATPELVRECFKALRSVRVLGDYGQVLPFTRVELTVEFNVYLRDFPAILNVDRLDLLIRQSLLQYVDGRTGRFTYTTTGFESAVAKASTDIQDVQIVTPSSDAGINPGVPQLPRYFLHDHDIVLNFFGPN